MENVIELQNVSKSFKGFQINNFSMEVKKGFVTGFIGGNGSGKSTTIKMIMNLINPDSGNVSLFGMNYSTDAKRIKERIGFVYDDNVFYDELTLKEITKIIAPAYKKWDFNQFTYYKELFELPLNKKMKTFSKRMKMKASLAIALSHHAELIIMDEPTSGLDPVFRRELLDVLQNIMQDGEKTIFFFITYYNGFRPHCRLYYIYSKWEAYFHKRYLCHCRGLCFSQRTTRFVKV
ncbi:ABC transporter ATP-binding protein [Bacillus anthracis str. UR-1]|nr:ABC transporter ATP-binding protein [Bacillus anthracis str. UR-1]